jgi:hypothetical protein
MQQVLPDALECQPPGSRHLPPRGTASCEYRTCLRSIDKLVSKTDNVVVGSTCTVATSCNPLRRTCSGLISPEIWETFNGCFPSCGNKWDAS